MQMLDLLQNIIDNDKTPVAVYMLCIRQQNRILRRVHYKTRIAFYNRLQNNKYERYSTKYSDLLNKALELI